MYIIRAVAPLHYACATITAGKEVKAKGKENATKAPRAEPAAKKQRQGKAIQTIHAIALLYNYPMCATIAAGKRVNTGKKGAQGKGKPGPQKPKSKSNVFIITK